MKDLKTTRRISEDNSKMSAKVIDNFLLYSAADLINLEHEMNKRFKLYRHISRELKKELTNRLKAQYIIHKVFKKEGLLKSYLNHPAIRNLDIKERNWLKLHSEEAWKFSFSVIENNPAENFFVMKDVFSDEAFLLYSPGVAKTLEEQSVILWFNLISFNGACWQSFGPIGAYKSFEPDDIFFFATELNPEIASEQEILNNVELNPVPS